MFFIAQQLEKFKKDLCNNEEIVTKIFDAQNKKIGIVYNKSMTDKNLLTQNILMPIINSKTKSKLTIKTLQKDVLKSINCVEILTYKEALDKVLDNQAVLMIEGQKSYISVDIESYPTRAPSEPPTSAVTQGPREGFVEDIKTNMTLLRRRFPCKEFAVKELSVGKYAKTKVDVVYLEGVADKNIVKKIISRIKKIDIDGIIDSNYIALFLEERPHSMFKQVGRAEKPDIVAAKMLEGRVAIVVSNSPIVLTLPFVFLEEMQASNDYYAKAQYATYLRWIRFFGVFMSVIIPGAYLSLRLYHYKIIPLKFLITISNSTQNLPATPFVELIFILLLFEILYEVSLRLPRYLGLATSIVGALILGETGVNAGLISPPGVMIIALSMISVYTMPDQLYQLTIIRALFLLLGGTLGLLGIIGGMIFLVNYLNTFNSYGSPYLAPFSPYIQSDMKDSLYKAPEVDMILRPKSIRTKNKVRLKKDED